MLNFLTLFQISLSSMQSLCVVCEAFWRIYMMIFNTHLYHGVKFGFKISSPKNSAAIRWTGWFERLSFLAVCPFDALWRWFISYDVYVSCREPNDKDIKKFPSFVANHGTMLLRHEAVRVRPQRVQHVHSDMTWKFSDSIKSFLSHCLQKELPNRPHKGFKEALEAMTI